MHKRHLSVILIVSVVTFLTECASSDSAHCSGEIACSCDMLYDCDPGLVCFEGICTKGGVETPDDTDFESSTNSETGSGSDADSENDSSWSTDTTGAGTDSDSDSAANPTALAKIFVLAGQSNMEGQGLVEPAGSSGTLAYMVANNGKQDLYSRLVTKKGEWKSRNDVWVEYSRDTQPVSGALTVGQGATSQLIGPEYGFGYEMGEALKSKVVIIKAAWGGKSLAVDFRPPSSGGETGPSYLEMLTAVDEAVTRLISAGELADGEYEIAGFGWHQGWNDAETSQLVDEYQENLSNLIRDLRQAWGVPEMPVVIGVSGMGGDAPPDPWFERTVNGIRPAQLAVAADPEFSDSVRAVDTVDFWRPSELSPADEGQYWNRNAESFYLIGVAMGQAMIELVGGAIVH